MNSGSHVTVQQVRFQDLSRSPAVTALCAGYELGDWRQAALVADVFDRHLMSFALAFTDLRDVDASNASTAIRKAAHAMYATDKYQHRGEFGELFLHAAAKDFFGAEPAISKVAFKDSPNDTVKGFDCVHIVADPDGHPELWLGEVKFYSDLSAAIRDSATELKAHLEAGFLRREFLAIVNKVDPAWPHAEALTSLLSAARTLDDIIPRLTIPVLLTYDSAAVSAHNVISAEYEDALEAEAVAAWEKFTKKLDLDFPVVLHLILMPIKSKKALVSALQDKLAAWKAI